MAGRVVVSTLNNDTGVLATQNGMSGIPKAWANINGLNGAVRDSFNISSVTRTAGGQYTVNFTTAMPNANYSVTGGISYIPGAGSVFMTPFSTGTSVSTPTTSSFRLNSAAYNSVTYDADYLCISVFSS
jgi:hypothetical protein